MIWSYGVTTVPRRRELLDATLASLGVAGFRDPWLFCDGYCGIASSPRESIGITQRTVPVLAWGNWVLAVWELYLRRPDADRFAVFQDDLMACRGLRTYLDHCPYPARGYWNLYTFMENEQLVEGKPEGWLLSPQTGRGAVALVFNREAVTTLLRQPAVVDHAQDSQFGKRKIDGTVSDAMRGAGWQEWVHNPSLVQHVGEVSTLGPKHHTLRAKTFRADWDATDLLRC
jgi:hypothetical protein